MTSPSFHQDRAYVATSDAGVTSYFGPYVATAVVVDEDAQCALANLDLEAVLHGDPEHSITTRRHLEAIVCFETVVISPSRYNQMVGRFSQLNGVQAWAHATAAEELLSRFPHIRQLMTPLEQTIITPALRPWGRRSMIETHSRTSTIVGYLAATIIARAVFEQSLRRMAHELRVAPPRNSRHEEDLARTILARDGMAGLATVAKISHPLTEQLRMAPVSRDR